MFFLKQTLTYFCQLLQIKYVFSGKHVFHETILSNVYAGFTYNSVLPDLEEYFNYMDDSSTVVSIYRFYTLDTIMDMDGTGAWDTSCIVMLYTLMSY